MAQTQSYKLSLSGDVVDLLLLELHDGTYIPGANYTVADQAEARARINAQESLAWTEISD